MPHKAVYFLAVPGFADWEPSHALAELRRHGGYRVEVVGLTLSPVESMGGLRVQPDHLVTEVDPDDVAVLVIPGGDRWETDRPEPELLAMWSRLDAAGIPIAAICAATVAITRAGLVRGRRHTSNGRAYLAHHAPGYADGAQYVDAPAVRDRGLITASGLADVEFAVELFNELNVLTDSDRAVWSTMFRSGRFPADVTGAPM
jgi:putative intracellular protease/amidase